MATPPMPREFSAGRVLGRSFAILFSNGGAFLLLVVILHLPVILLRIYLTTDAATSALKDNGPAIAFSAAMFLQPLAAGAVTYGVLRQLGGKPLSFAECLSAGMSRMFVVFLVGIAAGLIALCGMFALCLPGIIALVVFFVAAPASVVEGLGVVDALRRSEELTRERWLPVFGVLAFVLALHLGVVTVLFFKFFDWHQNPPVPPTSRAYLVADIACSLVLQAIQAVVCAVAYHDLRRAREGGDARDFLSISD